MIQVFNIYVSLKSPFLVLSEGVLIVLSILGGTWLRFWNEPNDFVTLASSSVFLMQTLTVVLVFQICIYFNGLYDAASVAARSRQLVQLAQALGAACILLGILYSLIPVLLLGRGALFWSVLIAGVAVALNRAGIDGLWKLAAVPKNVLILGDGELARAVARAFEDRFDLNFRVVGLVSPSASGTQICAFATTRQVSRIVVAIEQRRGVLPVADLVRLHLQGIQVEDAHTILAALTRRVWLQGVSPSWLLFSSGFRCSSFTLLAKRAADQAFGLLGLILTSPLLLLVAIAVKLDSKGPVLYRQERVGFGGKIFQVLKFRSMQADAEAQNGAQWAAQNDPRVTRVGRFLRRYRIDELPQLVNIVRGEMSFVGPRPERPCFVERLRERIPFYDERHSVRPGLTGWAQVEHSYGASFKAAFRKLEYDLFYLKNLSIAFDLLILLRTARLVLAGQGSQPGESSGGELEPWA